MRAIDPRAQGIAIPRDVTVDIRGLWCRCSMTLTYGSDSPQRAGPVFRYEQLVQRAPKRATVVEAYDPSLEEVSAGRLRALVATKPAILAIVRNRSISRSSRDT